jgi:hypothetical protein
MNDEELTLLLQELVTATVTIAKNVEVLASAAAAAMAEKEQRWTPEGYDDD